MNLPEMVVQTIGEAPDLHHERIHPPALVIRGAWAQLQPHHAVIGRAIPLAVLRKLHFKLPPPIPIPVWDREQRSPIPAAPAARTAAQFSANIVLAVERAPVSVVSVCQYAADICSPHQEVSWISRRQAHLARKPACRKRPKAQELGRVSTRSPRKSRWNRGGHDSQAAGTGTPPSNQNRYWHGRPYRSCAVTHGVESYGSKLHGRSHDKALAARVSLCKEMQSARQSNATEGKAAEVSHPRTYHMRILPLGPSVRQTRKRAYGFLKNP